MRSPAPVMQEHPPESNQIHSYIVCMQGWAQVAYAGYILDYYAQMPPPSTVPTNTNNHGNRDNCNDVNTGFTSAPLLTAGILHCTPQPSHSSALTAGHKANVLL